MNDDRYAFPLECETKSVIRDFESCLRTENIPKNDTQMILKNITSFFITFELPPGACNKSNLSDFVHGDGEEPFIVNSKALARKPNCVLTNNSCSS